MSIGNDKEDAECAMSLRERFAVIIADADLSANDAETIQDAIEFYQRGNAGLHADVYALLSRIIAEV